MVRIYLCGAGAIARQHAAATHFLGEPVELHVFDPSKHAVDELVAKEPGAIVHESVDSLLAEPARPGDIVIVATPPASHADLAIRGFASGRHVLCEKPLGMSLSDGRRMLHAARTAGKQLGDCSMRFLGYGASAFIRAQLEANAFGALYHVTCRHRFVRSRSGIEYQPETRWFLDRSKSGGGVVLDWSVYDLATVFDLFSPLEVEIRDAWTAQPRTSADPRDVTFDVETHVGATMRVTTVDGHTFALSYERASCTHGSPSALMEIEGLDGAATWNWLPYVEDNTAAIVRSDAGAAVKTAEHTFSNEGTPNWHHRPLLFFHDHLKDDPSPLVANETALFNFAVVRGIYEVAETGRALTVRRADFEIN